VKAQPRNRQRATSTDTTAATDGHAPSQIPAGAFSVERALTDAIAVTPSTSDQPRQGVRERGGIFGRHRRSRDPIEAYGGNARVQ